MLLPPLIRLPIPLNQGLPICLHSVQMTSPVAPSPNTITLWGRETQHMSFGRDTVQSITTTGLGNECRKTRVPNLSLGITSYLDTEIVKRSIQIEKRGS